MAKNTKQIALIQHRRGKLSELPYQLNEAEFALATDTNDIFLGNPNNPVLLERVNADEPVFPYGNIQILTEFTDNMNKIEYTFNFDSSNVKYPIIATGTVNFPTVPTGSSLFINDVEVVFTNEIGDSVVGLNEVVAIINKTSSKVKANVSNGFLQLITTENVLSLENGIVLENQKGAIESFGFDENIFSSNTPNSRPLQEVLDDRASIKNFDVYGDGTTNDNKTIYNTIIALFGEDKASLSKELFFPSGNYLINDNLSLLLISNTHLKGEGIGRTVIKSTNGIEPLLVTGDSNYTPATSDNYMLNAIQPSNILVEDMTFDISESGITNLLYLGTCKKVYFRNVEFIGREASILVNTATSSNIVELVFENCRFKGLSQDVKAQNAIVINGELSELNINNSDFARFSNEAIIISSIDNHKQTNGIITSNNFTNCGETSNVVLRFGETSSYINVAHNVFDKEVIEQTADVKPYINDSELNNIDILNAKEDTRKFLRFKFNQPVWDYIDSMINPSGDYLIKAIYSTDSLGNVSEITNSLEIEQGDNTNNNTFSILSTNPEGNLSLKLGKYGILNLGEVSYKIEEWEGDIEYKAGDKVEFNYDADIRLIGNRHYVYEALEDHTSSIYNAPNGTESVWKLIGLYRPSILVHRDIDLNGNFIRSSNSEDDIKFYMTNNNIIAINDDESTVAYEYRIASNDNALTNVAYVNRLSNPVIREKIDFSTFDMNGDSKIELINFDPTIYGDFIYLKKASFNVRRPYYPLRKYVTEDAIEWKPGYTWYEGDVVKQTDENGTYYYACCEKHISNAWLEDLEQYKLWVEVSQTGEEYETGITKQLTDVKYVSIYATNNIDAERMVFDKSDIDISRRDVNGLYYKEVIFGQEYNQDDIVLYQDRYWKCETANTPVDAYDLHTPSKWIMVNETGYNYIFDFERNLYTIDPITGIVEKDSDFVIEYNFAGYQLFMEFYDENGNLLPVVKTDWTEPNYTEWQPYTEYTILNENGDVNVVKYNGVYYMVMANFTSGSQFNTMVDGEVVLSPMETENYKKVQVSPSGAMLLNIEYMRGNG